MRPMETPFVSNDKMDAIFPLAGTFIALLIVLVV